MKKLIFFIVGMVLTLTAFSQNVIEKSPPFGNNFERLSETEKCSTGGEPKTIEDCVQGFIDAYGVGELHFALDAIESGKIEVYKDMIDDEKMKYDVDFIAHMIRINMAFIEDSKIYALTYEPIDLDIVKTPNGEEGVRDDMQRLFKRGIHTKSLYLFRRDDDGWKKASDLVRVDYVYRDSTMREFLSNNHNFKDESYGGVNRISNGNVFISFGSRAWLPEKPEIFSYISIIVFIPNGDETYRFSYFEPEDITKKPFPILYGTNSIDYDEINDGNGLKIEYYNGTHGNPIKAGTLCFNTVDGEIDYSGTIKLNKIR